MPSDLIHVSVKAMDDIRYEKVDGCADGSHSFAAPDTDDSPYVVTCDCGILAMTAVLSGDGWDCRVEQVDG